jgi:hypothetical protein
MFFLSCLDLAIMVFFSCSYIFQGDETLMLQWFQVSNTSCFCVPIVLLLFIIVYVWPWSCSLLFCVCRFQKLGKGKLDTWLNLTHGGAHRVHHFLQMNKGMP